jgi:hypothetical protein
MKLTFHYSIASAITLAAFPVSSFAQNTPPTNAAVQIAATTNAITLTVATNITPTQSTNEITLQSTNQTDDARASELLHKYNNDLVFVTGKSGAASGFVARYKNRKFFITNAHVLADLGYLSLETLDRSPLQVQSDAAMAAVGHDLIAIPVTVGGDGIPAIETFDTDVSVGDSIVVFGNALAGGVVNPLPGKVSGLGPRIVEVSGQFEPGSSGGPIIHLRTGKVICIATYVTRTEKISGEQSTRRFGYRLDTVAAWQHIDFKRFQYESDVLNAVHSITRQLEYAVEDATQQLPQNDAQVVEVDGRQVIVPPKQVIMRHEYESPLIRDAVANYLNSIAGKTGNTDDAGALLLDSLNSASANNIAAAAPLLTYDFFKHGDAEIPGWSREEPNGFQNEAQARVEILRELTARLQRK